MISANLPRSWMGGTFSPREHQQMIDVTSFPPKHLMLMLELENYWLLHSILQSFPNVVHIPQRSYHLLLCILQNAVAYVRKQTLVSPPLAVSSRYCTDLVQFGIDCWWTKRLFMEVKNLYYCANGYLYCASFCMHSSFRKRPKETFNPTRLHFTMKQKSIFLMGRVANSWMMVGGMS